MPLLSGAVLTTSFATDDMLLCALDADFLNTTVQGVRNRGCFAFLFECAVKSVCCNYIFFCLCDAGWRVSDIGKTVAVQYGTVLLTDVYNSSHALGRVYQVAVTYLCSGCNVFM